MDGWPEAPKLEVPDAYAAYLEYCKLFNVPEPAHKNPFGKYLTERYKIESDSSSRVVDGKKQTYRYYPGLYQVKSPKTVFAEFSLKYYSNTTGILSNTTGIPQEWISNNSIIKGNTTGTTGEQSFLKGIIEELEIMYKYVHYCKDPSEISYRKFLAHSPVVAVVSEENGPEDSEKNTTGGKLSCGTPVVSLYILKDIPAFMGVDGLTYGPFKPDDTANIPVAHAKGLISKGVCRLVGTQPSPKPDRLCSKCHKPVGMSAVLPGLGEVCLDCLEAST